ncbi:MAG: hypothetical protein NZ522_04440 [Chitinophagales bacterium]|nr:hypothetical protein [Chitinophagales bacterium]
MKYVFVLTFLFISLMSLNSYAQPQGGDRVESLRVAFITDYLQLTPEESQKFWPIYNQYRNELKSLRQSFRLDVSGEDDPQYADKKLEFEQKKLDLQKKYRPQFEQSIGPKKFNLLISAEEKFKQELLKRLQEKK